MALLPLVAALSALVQLVAAVLALRLVRVTGRALSWLLVAGGLLLMAARRVTAFLEWYRGGSSLLSAGVFELLGLAVSLLMAAGIALIGPLLRSMRDSERAIRASELKYRGVFDSAPQAVFLFDEETGRVMDANPAACSLFGRSREELRALCEADLTAGAPDGAVAAGPLASPFLRWYRKSDGTLFPAEISGTSFVLRGQRVSVVSIQDVTARRRLEERALRAERVMAVGRMAGGVAHRLNNMMVAVTGYASLLLQRLPEGHPAAREARCILEAGQRAASLTRQLLAIGRRQMLQPREIDAGDFLRSLEPRLRAAAGAGVALSVEAGREPLRAFLDPDQLATTLEALVRNARDATDGRGAVAVRATSAHVREGALARDDFTVAPGRYVVLSVCDDGVGMDAATRAQLFTPFFTTKEGGEGLDLASAYGFVKQSGGYLLVESEPGKGSLFSLYFPFSPAEPALSAAAQERPAGSLEEGEAPDIPRGARVLVMDDEEMVRNVAADILEHFGCEAILARNGEEAVAAYRAAAGEGRPVDAAIVDLSVPHGMGGLEAARRIREFDPMARLVVSSGYTDDPAMVEFGRHGFCAAIPKPYRVREFKAALRVALAGMGPPPEPPGGRAGPA